MVNNTDLMQRLRGILAEILGLGLDDLIGPGERVQHIQATARIGVAVGLMYSVFNYLSPGMQALGMVQFAAVTCLVVPAWLLSRKGLFIRLSENLILFAAMLIFMALIVFGGVDGTGLFWVYAFPFLAFFLKGQRQGWWFSLAFLSMGVAYFLWFVSVLSFAYPFRPVYVTHFVLSYCFYILIAAAFNLLRSRFEEQLQKRVVEKTAAATAYLEQLQYLATHDALTGLPNRVKLIGLIQEMSEKVEAAGQGMAVCSIRVERMFELGNVLGFEGADSLAMQITAHLRQITEGKAVLARMRRDEFVIVYPLATPTIRVEKLRQLIVDHPLSAEAQGYTLHIEFVLGLSVFPIHARDPQMLLKKAEQAMLQARRNGEQWMIYDENQDQVFVRHHLLFGKLRSALSRGHLQVHYQPQIDLASGRVIGAEALSRWHDPVEGPISPAEFVPVSEESGLIRPLTAWLARESMRECARWCSQGLDLHVSINISAVSLLDPQLYESLVEAAGEAGLPTDHVHLELTESCFTGSLERTMAIMGRLHDAGFRLSIDDYGTGYSSLSYLKFLPIDELKIDQAFVRNLLDTPSDQAIVISTIDLAHNFNLAVVAEGIEDAETAAWLRLRKCETGQGYSFSRPLPAGEFEAYARRSWEKTDKQGVLA